MKKFIIYAFLFIFAFQAQAQEKDAPIARSVQERLEAGTKFIPLDLFKEDFQLANSDQRTKATLTRGTILDLNEPSLNKAIEANEEAVSLRIPSAEKGEVEVLLVRANIFADDFKATDQYGNEFKDVDFGTHYRGIVKGDQHSLVAISVFKNEVMGFISTHEGNHVIGRLGGKNKTNQHVFYLDKDLTIEPDFSCYMEDDGLGYSPEDLKPLDHTATKLTTDKCVRIYVEINEDIYADKGGACFSYLAGVFNQSAAIYANEAITLVLSPMLAWVSGSPYTGTTTSTLLNQFQANRNSFNGDLGHLVGYAGGGGLAAGFNGFCNANLDNSMCYSDIGSSYSNVPTYSWTIMVFTHEMGHLMGSRHTHACVWNGNNTAIDGCSGFTEGSCAIPGVPSNGGTIMSYCHQDAVGINFNEGFGPQPGNLIRNNASGAACLTSCSCLDDLALFGNMSSGDNLEYEAGNTITSIQEVTGNTDIEYKAGTSITLNAGFSIASGSTLSATIGACTNAKMAKSGAPDLPLASNLRQIETQGDGADTGLTSFPNPFTGTTTIQYQLAEDARVSLVVFNTLGKQIQVLVNDDQARGEQRIKFNADGLAPGLYYATLRVNEVMKTIKLAVNNR